VPFFLNNSLQDCHKAKSEIRRPKLERSPRSEIRISAAPGFRRSALQQENLGSCPRISDFEFRASFGLRISAFRLLTGAFRFSLFVFIFNALHSFERTARPEPTVNKRVQVA